jgi:uncharacterized protein
LLLRFNIHKFADYFLEGGRMLSNFDIEFIKLKNGLHEFDYQLRDAFFSEKEGSLYRSGHIDVHLTFRKSENLFVLDFSLAGYVLANCDRCMNEIKVPLQSEAQLNVRINAEKAGDDEPDLWYIHPSDYKLNLYDYLYDSICVSLPLRKVCNESLDNKVCDESIEQRLQESNESNDTTDDPRWSKLKDLLNN